MRQETYDIANFFGVSGGEASPLEIADGINRKVFFFDVINELETPILFMIPRREHGSHDRLLCLREVAQPYFVQRGPDKKDAQIPGETDSRPVRRKVHESAFYFGVNWPGDLDGGAEILKKSPLFPSSIGEEELSRVAATDGRSVAGYISRFEIEAVIID